MKKYFKYKSTTDLIDSVINRKCLDKLETPEESSIKQVLAFDGLLDDPFQQLYIDNIKNGKYGFLEVGDSNWDYYIDKDSYVYSIAKVEGCKSCHYGSLAYYNRRKKEALENKEYTKIF